MARVAQIEEDLRDYEYYDRGFEYVRHRDFKEVNEVESS